MITQFALFLEPEPPPVDVQPNAHGVFPHVAAEKMVLREKARAPLAEIALLHLPSGWLQSTSGQLSDRGWGEPLTARRGFLSSRAAALDAAVETVRLRTSAADDPYSPDRTRHQANQVRRWLESLT